MNERVVSEPINGARSSLSEELKGLRDAADQKRWRDFLQTLPQLTERFHDVTELVESRWNTLCDQDQDQVLAIEEDIRELIEAPPQPNLGERVLAFVLGTSDDERRRIRRVSAAIGAFLNAVGRQIREENRIRKLLDDAAATDADTIRRLEIGAAEKAEGAGTEFRTPEEFRTRFG
jgi:hypothetical protein